MDARLYLSLAEHLVAGARAAAPLTGGTGAPECRCAISRAYYAAYNVVVAFLDQIGFRTENVGSCHTAVQFAFNQSGSTELGAVAAHLGTLYAERRRADYELSNPRPEQVTQAELVLKLAADAIRGVEAVRAAPAAWGAIATAVLNYVTTSQTAALRRKSGTA